MFLLLTPGLAVLVLLVPGSVLAGKCDDCLTMVAGLREASVSELSLSYQQGMILSMICPDAGLGGPDDHPNCEKFTEHHFPDLLNASVSFFLSPDLCTTDLGFCPDPTASFREVDCDTCMAVTRLAAGILGQENSIIRIIDFLTSDFCLNGVPEQDVEFCDSYVRVVMPIELPWLANAISNMSINICDYFFDLCML